MLIVALLLSPHPPPFSLVSLQSSCVVAHTPSDPLQSFPSRPPSLDLLPLRPGPDHTRLAPSTSLGRSRSRSRHPSESIASAPNLAHVHRPLASLSLGVGAFQSAMGTYGYAGLVSLGQLPITVGSKTASHKVMLSEESNFDVVLGRAWAEKMGIKTDPADVTSVTYMENGEQIPVDIVVLKDANGEIITVT